jgi:hypothetical protein
MHTTAEPPSVAATATHSMTVKTLENKVQVACVITLFYGMGRGVFIKVGQRELHVVGIDTHTIHLSYKQKYSSIHHKILIYLL